jgi:exosome complex exonuclease RRP6
MMRNELIDKSNTNNPEENRLEIVLQKSKETSLLRYEPQVYDHETGRGPGGWFNLLVKTPALLSKEQFAVFKAVHAWRDRIAREDDDSINYVMPNHAIFNVAKNLPTDMVSLLGAIHPISHNVKSRSGELLALIKKAIADGKNGPSMMEVLRPDSVGAMAKANLQTSADAVPTTINAKEEAIRSDVSKFWGDAFGSSIWEPRAPQPISNLRLAIPLPQLTSDIFATPQAQSTHIDTDFLPTEDMDATPSKPQLPVQIVDEPFNLKAGRKRKSDALEEEEEVGEDEGEYDISLNSEEESLAREKAARKAERKAQKKAEKAARRAIESGPSNSNSQRGDGEDEEEAFDYAKAESVLHGKKDAATKGKKGGEKKPFNPYAKSADAPKGMRRVQSERAGKSFTFRN